MSVLQGVGGYMVNKPRKRGNEPVRKDAAFRQAFSIRKTGAASEHISTAPKRPNIGETKKLLLAALRLWELKNSCRR